MSNDDITVIATVFPRSSLLITAIVAIWRTRFTTRVQVLLQCDNSWASRRDARRKAATALLAGSPTADVDRVLRFFETLAGIFVKPRGVFRDRILPGFLGVSTPSTGRRRAIGGRVMTTSLACRSGGPSQMLGRNSVRLMSRWTPTAGGVPAEKDLESFPCWRAARLTSTLHCNGMGKDAEWSPSQARTLTLEPIGYVRAARDESRSRAPAARERRRSRAHRALPEPQLRARALRSRRLAVHLGAVLVRSQRRLAAEGAAAAQPLRAARACSRRARRTGRIRSGCRRCASSASTGSRCTCSDVDMLDGTPVLDIKPYVAYTDAIADAGSGWLANGDAPRDPIPAFAVHWDAAAGEQAEWIEARTGLNLRERATATLALGPEPHPYRRIRREQSGFTLCVKDWRLRFRVDERDVRVASIESGVRKSLLVRGGRSERRSSRCIASITRASVSCAPCVGRRCCAASVDTGSATTLARPPLRRCESHGRNCS